MKTILCLNRTHNWKPLFKLALFSSALDNCCMLSFPSLARVAFFPATLCCSMLEVLHGLQHFILLFINFAALCSGSTSSWAWHSPRFNTRLRSLPLFSSMAATVTWFPWHDDCYKSCKQIYCTFVTLRRVWKSKLKKRRCRRQRSVESCLLWASLRWVLIEVFAYWSPI